MQAVFLWQGDNLLAELDGTATVKRAEYSYYPGLDNLHAVVINNERLYAHADGLGNVIALTDEAQGVRRVYAYDDWGNDAGTGGTLSAPNADRARWKGALWMGPELDLYYMRNRWYEPATGRFLSEDPIGLAGGINPVSFSASDPVNGRDELGLASQRRECYPFCNLHKPDGFLDPTPTLPDDTESTGGGGGNPSAAPSCSAELISLVGAAGLDLLSVAALGGGGLLIAKGSAVLIRGSAAELRTIVVRGGAATVEGIFRQEATYGLSSAARAGAARVQTGQSLLGVGSGLIAGDITTNISTGAARPFSLLDLLPGRGTYLAVEAFLACRRQQ